MGKTTEAERHREDQEGENTQRPLPPLFGSGEGAGSERLLQQLLLAILLSEAGYRCPKALPLSVLRCLAGTLEPVLLAFLRSRVTREESCPAQRLPVGLIVADQSARDAVTNGPRLSREATALYFYHDAEGTSYKVERFLHLVLVDQPREVLFEGPAVDHNGAAAYREAHASHSLFPATYSHVIVGFRSHVPLTPLSLAGMALVSVPDGHALGQSRRAVS
jgi:hypothetical protein